MKRISAIITLAGIIVAFAVLSGCDKSTDSKSDNDTPVASFTFSSPARPGKPITFDGTSSHDPDGSVVSYKWDFGDNTSSDDLRPSKSFASAGTYRVTLTVVDDKGKAASASKDIKVEANKRPIASFTYTTPVIINRTIYFDASGSYDPDGSITRVKWYFYQTQGSSTEKKTSEKFPRPGYTKVQLRVFDNEGDSTVLTKDIYVELTGSSSDCETYGGHYKLLPYRWKPTTGATRVIMTFSSYFRVYDPGWRSISANTGIYAMAEWHFYSGANLEFMYYTTIKDNLVPKGDGINALTFYSIDGKGGALARATVWYSTSTKIASEVDIVADWSEPWSVNGSSGAYDLQSVLTHEFGHLWMLDDLYSSEDQWETMYGYTGTGSTHARTLYCGDKRGAKALYGRKPSTKSLFAGSELSENLFEPYPETITVSSE